MVPDISIIMSTYNEEKEVLSKAINSILEQTFNNFEFIIINDNPGNDELNDLLTFFSNKDKRIKVIKNPKNIGLQKSLNIGINKSKGKYIARMDADDISLIDRLKIQYEFLQENEEIDLVCTNYQFIDENDNLGGIYTNISEKVLVKLPDFIRTNMIAHPSVMVKKDILITLNGYRHIKYAEDYDLWLRILKSGGKIMFLPQVLLNYRIRSNSISVSNKVKQVLTTIYVNKLAIKEKKISDNLYDEDMHNKMLNKNSYANTAIGNHNINKSSRINLIFKDPVYRKFLTNKIITYLFFKFLY